MTMTKATIVANIDRVLIGMTARHSRGRAGSVSVSATPGLNENAMMRIFHALPLGL